MSVQHDLSSVLVMAVYSLHNALCITLNSFKNLRLRIAIVRSAWRQPNISKHTSTVSCVENVPKYLTLKILSHHRSCLLIAQGQ